MQTKTNAQHRIDINLDSDIEANEFVHKHGNIRGRMLAKRLGFKGRYAVRAANALSNYAWNKLTACSLRENGQIADAMRYEHICDKIYREDIQPLIICW